MQVAELCTVDDSSANADTDADSGTDTGAGTGTGTGADIELTVTPPFLEPNPTASFRQSPTATTNAGSLVQAILVEPKPSTGPVSAGLIGGLMAQIPTTLEQAQQVASGMIAKEGIDWYTKLTGLTQEPQTNEDFLTICSAMAPVVSELQERGTSMLSELTRGTLTKVPTTLDEAQQAATVMIKEQGVARFTELTGLGAVPQTDEDFIAMVASMALREGGHLMHGMGLDFVSDLLANGLDGVALALFKALVIELSMLCLIYCALMHCAPSRFECCVVRRGNSSAV